MNKGESVFYNYQEACFIPKVDQNRDMVEILWKHPLLSIADSQKDILNCRISYAHPWLEIVIIDISMVTQNSDPSLIKHSYRVIGFLLGDWSEYE